MLIGFTMAKKKAYWQGSEYWVEGGKKLDIRCLPYLRELAPSYEELFRQVDNVNEGMPAGPIKDTFFLNKYAPDNLIWFLEKRRRIAAALVGDNWPAFKLRGRYSPGSGAERRIGDDANSSYIYAHKINGLFPIGELAISRDSQLSYMYAANLLQGPFPLGEEAISRNADLSLNYAVYVLKGPFPLGEEAIANGHHLYMAVYYAINALKDRFKLAEPRIFSAINLNTPLFNEYVDFLRRIGVDDAELEAMVDKYAGAMGRLIVVMGKAGKEFINFLDLNGRL